MNRVERKKIYPFNLNYNNISFIIIYNTKYKIVFGCAYARNCIYNTDITYYYYSYIECIPNKKILSKFEKIQWIHRQFIGFYEFDENVINVVLFNEIVYIFLNFLKFCLIFFFFFTKQMNYQKEITHSHTRKIYRKARDKRIKYV